MATLGTLSVAIDSDIRGLKRGLAAATASLGKFAGPVAAVGAGVAAVGVGAVKMAADFESQMSKVRGLVGASQEQVDAWGEDILRLAPELSKSPQELAEALFDVSSAGLDASQVIPVLTASAKAATAGLGETLVVAQAVTSAVNAYGIENLSASKATDVLVAAVKEGKLEAESLAPVIGRVIPLASELGVTFEQVGGVLSVMSLSGLDAAEATTALRGIMSTLVKPSEKARATLMDVGLSFGGLRQQVREKGLLSVLRLLQRRFKGNQEAMAAVFPNVRALTGVLNVLGVNSRTVSRIMRNVARSAGLTEKAFRTQKNTAKALWDELVSHLQVAMITLGNTILPPVIRALKSINKAIGTLAGTTKTKVTKIKGQWSQGMDAVVGNSDRGAASILRIVDAVEDVVSAVSGALDWLERLEDRASQIFSNIPSALLGGGLPALFARAHGGPVSAGRPFLVGERGPELFVPHQFGQIVPNERLGAGITINIQNAFGFDDFERKVTFAMGRAMKRAGAA